MNASRFRAILLLALTFAAGAAAGVAGDRLALFPRAAGASEADAPVADAGPRAEDRRERQTTIEKFADDLGLTAEQRGQIEGFLDYYRSSAKALQQAVRPQYRALMDSVRVQIESVLTDAQVEQYRDLLERRYGGNRADREDGEGRERGPARGGGAHERDPG